MPPGPSEPANIPIPRKTSSAGSPRRSETRLAMMKLLVATLGSEADARQFAGLWAIRPRE